MIQDTDYWTTPNECILGILRYAYDSRLINHNKYSVDVCANEINTKVRDNYITEELNAFKTEWGMNCLAWCNPPYSRGNVDLFVRRALDQWTRNRVETIMLLNCDNSTQWFSQVVAKAKAIVYLTSGRVRFLDYWTGKEGLNPPKANIFVIFGERKPEDGLISLYVDKNELYQLGINNERA